MHVLRYHVRTELYRAPIGRLRGPRRGADADVIHTFTIKHKVLTFAPHRLSSHTPLTHALTARQAMGPPRRQPPKHVALVALPLALAREARILEITDFKDTKKTLVNPQSP